MSDSIYNPENLSKLSGVDLYALRSDKYLKPEFEAAVLKESAVRKIINTSIECGVRSLKLNMTRWYEIIDDEKAVIGNQYLAVVNECIAREETGRYSKTLIKSLYIAKRKLEAAL